MTIDPEKSSILNTSEWISKSEAARLRGVSRQAIWELVKRGRLRPAMVKGRAYLKRAEVLNFKYGKRRPYSRIPAAELLTRLDLKKKYDLSQWLSLTEAAHALRISPQAITDLIRRRRLKTLVVAERTLISRAGMEKLKPRPGGTKARSKRAKKK